ncbi:hypothetical protein GCM10009765_77030 [Fodinicola feengrottensis]|uniref:Uncharacterized protein n=1 Tax=Fodinicola feengrottensis TaxID=435914 RepID=A0ABN2J3A6_9ACTN
MPVDPSLLQGARNWIDAHSEAVRQSGLLVEINPSPKDRPKQSIQWVLEGPDRIGEIILWETGEAELSFASIKSGEIRPEHRSIKSASELEMALVAVLNWTTDVPQ